MGYATEEQVEYFLKVCPSSRKVDHPFRCHPDQVLAGGRTWTIQDERLQARDEDSAQDLEAHAHGPAELQPLVRLLAGA